MILQPKTCPFCGEIPRIEPAGSDPMKFVFCENPKCYARPDVFGRTRKIAVERWNFRMRTD